MARTKFNKNGTVTIIGLTQGEWYMLQECLSRCQDVMSWDEDAGYAEDGDNFLWRIDDRKEYETLKNMRI